MPKINGNLALRPGATGLMTGEIVFAAAGN